MIFAKAMYSLFTTEDYSTYRLKPVAIFSFSAPVFSNTAVLLDVIVCATCTKFSVAEKRSHKFTTKETIVTMRI